MKGGGEERRESVEREVVGRPTTDKGREGERREERRELLVWEVVGR